MSIYIQKGDFSLVCSIKGSFLPQQQDHPGTVVLNKNKEKLSPLAFILEVPPSLSLLWCYFFIFLPFDIRWKRQTNKLYKPILYVFVASSNKSDFVGSSMCLVIVWSFILSPIYSFLSHLKRKKTTYALIILLTIFSVFFLVVITFWWVRFQPWRQLIILSYNCQNYF